MKSLSIALTLITLFVLGCNQRDNGSKISDAKWIKFDWEGDSVGGKYYDKLAMFVPMQIKGIPYKFTAQLDLGAPMTMVYGNTFSPLLKKYPVIAEKLDTLNKTYMIQGIKCGGFMHISYYLDTVLFKNRNIAYFEGYGDALQLNSFKKDTVIHIGTIGSNLFKNRTLVIDFKNTRFAILDSLTGIDRKNFVDIVIDRGRIKVPIKINGEKVYVLYDTGTSFAALYLSTNNWNKFRDTTSALDTAMVSAWGTKYPLFTSKTDIIIEIGNQSFRPETIMANNLKPYYDFYLKEKIIGLMGNHLFYNKTLIIDFKNNKLGILNN